MKNSSPESFVTFTCNTASSTAAKVNDESYTFGISGAASSLEVAQRIKDSIEKARLDSNTSLDIFATVLDSGKIHLRQGTGGVNGNTEIRISNQNLMRFLNFSEKSFQHTHTLALDPVVFLTDTGDIRFPIQEINFGLLLGTELDGVIEPLELREASIDRMITEKPIRGFKGSMGGSYNYSEHRGAAELIHDAISFEKTKIVPFLDNCPTIGSELGLDTAIAETRQSYLDVIYVKTPGFIFKNERTIYPFIDTEERISQALPLEANNPDNVDNDSLVAEIFELGNPVSLLSDDTRNLGGENYRRSAGFDFSTNPHPGTDSIVFGGLTYV